MLNVAIYAYSAAFSIHDVEKQLTQQVEQCQSYCIQKGYQVSAVYKEKDERKQLFKLIDEAKQGLFNKVVVVNHIKFGDEEDQVQSFIYRLVKAGVEVEPVKRIPYLPGEYFGKLWSRQMNERKALKRAQVPS